MSISETGDLYAAYVKGWDAALRNAAMSFWGADRDAILAHLKQGNPMDLKERIPSVAEAELERKHQMRMTDGGLA